MNPKLFFGLLIGLPTLLIIYIYNEFGINNKWQLFWFAYMIISSYLPAGIIYYKVYMVK